MSGPLDPEQVRCPECGAPAGQPCKAITGTAVMPHDQRRRQWEDQWHEPIAQHPSSPSTIPPMGT